MFYKEIFRPLVDQHGLQPFDDVVKRRPAPRIAVPAQLHQLDVPRIGARRRHGRPQRRLLVRHLPDQLHRCDALIRRPVRQQLPHDNSKAEYVGILIVWLAAEHCTQHANCGEVRCVCIINKRQDTETWVHKIEESFEKDRFQNNKEF